MVQKVHKEREKIDETAGKDYKSKGNFKCVT